MCVGACRRNSSSQARAATASDDGSAAGPTSSSVSSPDPDPPSDGVPLPEGLGSADPLGSSVPAGALGRSRVDLGVVLGDRAGRVEDSGVDDPGDRLRGAPAEVQQPVQPAVGGQQALPVGETEQATRGPAPDRLLDRDHQREPGGGGAGRDLRDERAGPAVGDVVAALALGSAEHVHADPVDARLAADAQARDRHGQPVGRRLAGREVAHLVVQAAGVDPGPDRGVLVGRGGLGELGSAGDRRGGGEQVGLQVGPGLVGAVGDLAGEDDPAGAWHHRRGHRLHAHPQGAPRRGCLVRGAGRRWDHHRRPDHRCRRRHHAGCETRTCGTGHTGKANGGRGTGPCLA